jgi:hypothetical protein
MKTFRNEQRNEQSMQYTDFDQLKKGPLPFLSKALQTEKRCAASEFALLDPKRNNKLIIYIFHYYVLIYF